ncbi:MAG: HDOD domain-containing protein, partial [Chromatiales bacterium]
QPIRARLSDLSHITPFKKLPPRVLAYIAKQVEVTHHDPGSSIELNGTTLPQVHLLLQGEVESTRADGSKQRIIGDPATTPNPAPLFTDGTPQQAVDRVSILHCPQDLYDNIQRLPSPEPQSGDPFTNGLESGIRDTEVFWKFYDAFKSGNLKLPSQPSIAMSIARVVRDPNTDSHHIARVIQADPSVAGRIISVVNSAAYRGRTPINNLPDAVTRLGRNVTHNLVISFALSGLFDSCSHTLNDLMSTAWKHASYVAAICHELGRVTPGLSADNALLCGLVHDIGVLPILHVARSQRDLTDNPEQLNLIIRRLKGEIGAVVLREWGFPAAFIQAAEHAEDWLQDINDSPSYVDLVVLAQLHAYIGSKGKQQLPRLDLVPALHKLALGNLTPRYSLHILENAKQNIQELQALLAGR